MSVVENAVKLFGKARFNAVGIAGGEHQAFGIPQPDPAAPNRRDGQDQGQGDKQQHLSAVADARTRGRPFRIRRWDFSTHGLYPPRGASPPYRLQGSPMRW